jgi:Flp pilus assembly pilin Flp
MVLFAKRFMRDECGAVTVDWVVLVAAVISLAVATFFAVKAGTMALAGETSTYLSERM